MTIGQRIMQIRAIAGMSQEEFGERLGTSRQTVSKWELDITVPEIEKIVKISKLFSVTTDSLLIEGISSFDEKSDKYICGVYKSDTVEIVETERVALLYYSNPEKTVFGAKAYVGFDGKKTLKAVCEYSADGKSVTYAYLTDEDVILSNDDGAKSKIGERFDASQKKNLYRSETFYISHDKTPLPTVDEAGIKQCLISWRMATTYNATSTRFTVLIRTGTTEYTFDIAPKDTNIYCGISYQKVTQVGLLNLNQFFRIRNYKDNSEKFCNSFSNLGLMYKEEPVSIEECSASQCSTTSHGLFFGIKRYTNDEIVLYGCGGDEYRYSRTDRKLERFCLE